MAADYSYDPGLVFSDETLAPAASATGILVASAESVTPLPVYDLQGNALVNLTTNSRGYLGRFRADVSDGFVRFGDLVQPVASVEQQRAGLSAQMDSAAARDAAIAARDAAEAAATSAEVAAQQATLASSGGGGGNANKDTTLGTRKRLTVNDPWPARPDNGIVASIGPDPSPLDQQPGDLRFLGA